MLIIAGCWLASKSKESLSCAAHSIVVYTGCCCRRITNHVTACLLPAKQATIRGKRPCPVFLGSMSGTSVMIRLMASVSELCAAKHNTFLYPLLFYRLQSLPSQETTAPPVSYHSQQGSLMARDSQHTLTQC